MIVVRPVAVTDALLQASSVPEEDATPWNAATAYALGARVMAGHRLYESAQDNNLAHDPAGDGAAYWVDTGPTNRWAMFDRAVGSATTATGGLSVTLEPGSGVDALGLLDMVAASVRVQALSGAVPLFDETRPVGGRTAMLFEGVPEAERIIVTLDGGDAAAAVSCGTLTMGAALILGDTEARPTVGITDYSRRETDDLGVTSVVRRDWAKTMTVRTRTDSDRMDAIQRAMAALRAQPALWVGDGDYDCMMVYGTYKDFQGVLTIGTTTYCSLTVKGLV